MDEQMDRWLTKDIGKSCFVNCFGVAWKNSGDITGDDVLKHHGKKLTTLDSRAYHIGRVFALRRERKVLRECCVNQHFPKSATKAQRLFRKYYG